MTSLKKLFLAILTTFAITISPALLAEIKLQIPQKIDGTICVEGIGRGITKQAALQDAKEKALENAIRMYNTANSGTTNNFHKGGITVSDAKITDYKGMLSIKHKGIWITKINANVVFNKQNQTKKNTAMPQIKGEISVEGIGHGTTRQEALQDAMRKVVEHAVGMYVTTRSELTNGSYKEKIITNSDAVITAHKELQAIQDGDTWTIKIQAKVLPNDSLKNMQKVTTQKVSSTDIGNLMNKINSLKQAEEAISEIFRDYYPRIIKFKKQGELRIDQTSDINNSEIRIKVDFVAYIDQNEFNIFQRKLCTLLDKYALQKEVRYASKGIENNLGNRILERAGLKKFNLSHGDVRFIAIQNHKKNDMVYTVYLVPAKIRHLIAHKLNFRKTAVICSFFFTGEPMPERIFFCIDSLRFYSANSIYDFNNDYGEICFNWGNTIYSPLTFLNILRIKGTPRNFDIENGYWNKKTTGTITLSIPIDHVKRLEEIYIYPVLVDDIQDTEKIKKAAIETEKLLWHKK